MPSVHDDRRLTRVIVALVTALVPAAAVACDAKLVDSPTTTTTTVEAIVVEGRPLRRRAWWRRGKRTVVHVARSRRGPRTLTDRQALAVPAVERLAIGEHWRRLGELEHASVVAFVDIARRLQRLGAPGSLVHRAERAAVQEQEHADRCFALASRYLGVTVTPGRLRQPHRRVRRDDLAVLAEESVRDGMYNEGFAAWLALHAGRRVVDQRVAETLRVIARDEAGHARLSADIVAWCVAEGQGHVADRVARAAATLPQLRAPELPAADPETLARHGVVGDDDASRLAAADIRDVVAARCSAIVAETLASLAA